MNMQTLLSLQNIGLTFKAGHRLFSKTKSSLLQEISLDLYSGETLGIVGRNGAGKSTLLKVLAGIYQPTQGHIKSSVSSISLLNLQLGFDENLNAYDNIILSGMLVGHSKSEMKQSSEEIIAFSELGEAANRPIRSYSTGMKARLGFSISTISRADVTLLDEVLSVGDGHFMDKAEASMRKMIKSRQTVVFVSHDLAKVRELCDRVCWLEAGRIRAIGESSLIMDEYEQDIHQI